MATPLRNRLHELREQRTDYASHDDVLTAVVELKKHVKALLDSRVSRTESDIAVRVDSMRNIVDDLNAHLEGKIIDAVSRKFIDKLEETHSKFDKQFGAVQSVYEAYNRKISSVEVDLGVQMGKILESKIDKALGAELVKTINTHVNGRLDELHTRYEKNLSNLEESYNKRLGSIEEKHEQEISFIRKVCEQNLEQLRLLVTNLQLPTPSIQVHVPEQKTPNVNVSVPEQKTPEVIVNLPELKHDVVVQIPQPRLVKKHIEYDGYGRPVVVQEQEMKETE